MSPRMPLPWQRAATGANLLSPDGSLGVTIFEEMTTLALSTGAINLGQGFPDEDGPVEIKEAAQAAIAAGANQYAPGKGILPLREAIALALARQAETSPFLASLELASRLRVVSAAPVAAIGAALITPTKD